ncbi:UbiA family prenyltransferase [Martelella mediterranea]|uniref:UbiA family prenyltransferase n=1 Tax=Martelella mediterranea TaxID=293089 RepID=UPI001E551A73|nr:UbiA family prenyltransferase [Martelella mediterranea]MCD1634202.1 UbiA family prenyltransferase [Martelella mediterranea]
MMISSSEMTPLGNAQHVQYPIVVDLDGTLVHSDSLHESLMIALFRHPQTLLSCAWTLANGRHAFKAKVADVVSLVDFPLPFREDLVSWLHQKKQEGCELHLCSAADQRIVDAVAASLGIFATAVGSNGENLKGAAKARHLVDRFPDGFIYVGNDRADLEIWRHSKGIVTAGISGDVKKAVDRLDIPVLERFENPRLSVSAIAKAIRVHHWSKNALVFVPLILAHAWGDIALVLETVLAFIALLSVTSGTYLLNDISDLRSDRLHWSKKNRALASGALSIRTGLALSLALFILGFGIAAFLSLKLLLALLGYLVLTGAYSLGLKRVPLLDMLVIGVLFTIRLVVGIVLIDGPSPAWLLTFAVFFFFSLAAAKRHTEILRASALGSESLRARGYEPEDEPLTLAIGVGAALASLVVIVLFILQEMLPGNAYARPELLGGIPLLLSIWLGRIWLLSHRGKMTDDPVSFAIRDRVSLWLALLIALLFVGAL